MATTESEVVLRLDRTTEGTQADIEGLYRAHGPAFFRVCHAITGDAESAKDALQEALTRALGASTTSKRRVRNSEAWLWAIVINTAKTVRRRDRREAIARLADRGESPVSSDVSLVRHAVAALPERQRHVLFLRYYADLDYASIAEVLGIRRGTVSATLHQAQNALRQALPLEETR